MSEVLDALHQPHTQLLLRLVLGGLLLLAGVAKLRDRPAFHEAIADYQVLSGVLQRPFATLLPLVEVTLGVLLLLGFGTRVAAALATPLFLSFGTAIGVNMLRGRHIDCHCFGTTQRERIGWMSLLRSVALMLAALTVAVGASRFGALELPLFGANGALPSPAEVVPIVFLALVIFDVLFLLPETLAFQSGLTQARAGRNRHSHSHTSEATA